MMYPSELVQKVIKKFPGCSEIPLPEKFVRDPSSQIQVVPEKLHALAKVLRDDPELAFDLPNFMTGVDLIKDNVFDLVYYLFSTRHKHGIIVKSRVPRDRPEIVSLTDIWGGMNFQEREVYDLMGISFKNHPFLKRIMLWEGYPGFPLRKDYVHVTDRYDSGMEVGTPGFDEKGIPIKDIS